MKYNFHILYLNRLSAVSPGMLVSVWGRIGKDGIYERLFYDGAIRTESEFLYEMVKPGVLPFVVMGNGEIAAFSWLCDITSRMARTHFFISRPYQGRRLRIEIGRHLYSYILTRKDQAGYLFDCLYGITPKSNPLAWKAACSCGWQKCGEIPNACFIDQKRSSEAGVITCATREILAIDPEDQAEARWSYTQE